MRATCCGVGRKGCAGYMPYPYSKDATIAVRMRHVANTAPGRVAYASLLAGGRGERAGAHVGGDRIEAAGLGLLVEADALLGREADLQALGTTRPDARRPAYPLAHGRLSNEP